MAFHQSVKCRSRIVVNLEVLSFDVDDDEFLGVLLHVDLRANDSFEDFIPSFYELGFFLGHGTGSGL